MHPFSLLHPQICLQFYNLLTMEKTSPNTLSPYFLLVIFVGSLFHGILIAIQMFCLSFGYFLLSQLDFISDKSKGQSENKFLNSELLNQNVCIDEKVDDGKLSREDVEMVMEKMSIVCNPNGEKLQERLGSDDFLLMFEEKEPSVKETEGAFDVFDENKDGFVEATDLQRVLRSLGFREGSEVHECERMIRTFDENGDGRIDFNEFVKLMEKSFC